jgi:hypothetical protein
MEDGEITKKSLLEERELQTPHSSTKKLKQDFKKTRQKK